jgi:hypothetical protein
LCPSANRDAAAAEPLLTQTLNSWQRQPPTDSRLFTSHHVDQRAWRLAPGGGKVDLNEWPEEEAESQLGLACEHLNQLEQDAIACQKANPIFVPDRLKFNIDDGASALDISCTRLKNKEYVTRQLERPDALQQKAYKLYNLS